MIPFTLQIRNRFELFQPGIPISGMLNQELYLPDSRRLMTGSIENSRILAQSGFTKGFRIMNPIYASLVYPNVMFREGQQNWVKIEPAAKPDQDVLVYVTTTLPLTEKLILTAYEDQPEKDIIQWLLEPKVDLTEAGQQTITGLFVLQWGQSARFACVPREQETDFRFVDVTVTLKKGRPALSYSF